MTKPDWHETILRKRTKQRKNITALGVDIWVEKAYIIGMITNGVNEMLKTKSWKNFHNESQTTTFELKKNLEGKTSEYWTILAIAQNGISLQNKWGGFNVRNSGKPIYIQKIWNNM